MIYCNLEYFKRKLSKQKTFLYTARQASVFVKRKLQKLNKMIELYYNCKLLFQKYCGHDAELVIRWFQ